MIQIIIKVTDDELTLTEKFPVYEEGICLSHDDPKLSRMVKEVLDKFKSVNQPDVLIKIKYTW